MDDINGHFYYFTTVYHTFMGGIYLFVCVWFGFVGVWSTAFYIWIIEIWQQKSNMVLFLAQFLYGTGFVLGPMIARPFVSGGVPEGVATNVSFHTTISVEERRSKLVVPFIIGGGF